MASIGALTIWLALAGAGAGDEADRLLLCRATVAGDAALARPEAVMEAGRSAPRRFLDYGVGCESPSEAARAARRAGLAHAVAAVAEGGAEGSVYRLTLAGAADGPLGERELVVAPGADAVAPLRAALLELGSLAGRSAGAPGDAAAPAPIEAAPPPVSPAPAALLARRAEPSPPREGAAWAGPVGWGLVGIGAAALAAGAILAVQARDLARRADAATTAPSYLAARGAWGDRRGWSVGALAGGGAALAAGLTVKLTL